MNGLTKSSRTIRTVLIKVIVVFFFLTALVARTSAASIKVATWNVLAPQYAMTYKYPWCAPEHLDWNHRQPLIVSQIQEMDPDILCLQEVQVDLWSHLLEGLESYDAVIQNVTNEHNVAIAILVRKDCPFCVERVESRSRVLLAVLRSKLDESQNLYLGSVHLEAGTEDGNDLQRYHQLKSLFKRLRLHCSMDGTMLADASIILAGDFNMLRTNFIYDCLRKGELNHPEKIKIKPVPIVKFHDSIPVPITFAKGYALDFIFTSAGIEIENQIHQSPLATQGVPQLWPSEEYPSDHLPIGVTLSV
jgi:endonuclease/exonuclease/phosphatase family metal-dependent hydrolase